MEWVLAHEHLALKFFEPSRDHSSAVTWSLNGLKQAMRHGLAEVWDLTNQTFGRDLDLLAALADASGVSIVASTGHYLDQFHPDDTRDLSVAELARRWLRDLQNRVGSVRVGIIGEIATGNGTPQPSETRALQAAAAVQAETGAPIYTHTTYGTLARYQLEVLLAAGALAELVVIGHADVFHPLDELLSVAQAGAYLGIDTLGKQHWRGLDGRFYQWPDVERLRLIQALVTAGYDRQIVLSSDLLYERGELEMNPSTFGRFGYDYLPAIVTPMFGRLGLGADSVSRIAGLNARRLLVA